MASLVDDRVCWQVTLTRHKTTNSVLYMEAGKEFVDLLFSFLTLPMVRVSQLIALLEGDRRKPHAAMSNILDSVQRLPVKDFAGETALRDLLCQAVCADLPKDVACLVNCISNQQTAPPAQQNMTYFCRCNSRFCMEFINATCMHPGTSNHPECWTRSVMYSCKNIGEGFVGVGSLGYMITNELRITRASPTNTIGLLAQLNVRSLSELKTCEVKVGAKQALQSLEAFIRATSKTMLSDIFPPDAVKDNVVS